MAILEQIIERLLAGEEEIKVRAYADREQMLARMSTNIKTMQGKADAVNKSDRKNLKDMMKATQERM
jgi:hypothetical protein